MPRCCFKGDPASKATGALAFENLQRKPPVVLGCEHCLKCSKCHLVKVQTRSKHLLQIYLVFLILGLVNLSYFQQFGSKIILFDIGLGLTKVLKLMMKQWLIFIQGENMQ